MKQNPVCWRTVRRSCDRKLWNSPWLISSPGLQDVNSHQHYHITQEIEFISTPGFIPEVLCLDLFLVINLPVEFCCFNNPSGAFQRTLDLELNSAGWSAPQDQDWTSIILSSSMWGNSQRTGSHIPNSTVGFYGDPLVGVVIWEMQY